MEARGESADLANVLDECRTPSLLAPLRVVLVRGADEFVSGGRNEKKSHRELLEKYLESRAKISTKGVLQLTSKAVAESVEVLAERGLNRLRGQIAERLGCHADSKRVDRVLAAAMAGRLKLA